MEIANSLIDKPAIKYRSPEEGISPEDGFDCSGFVTYVLNKAGLHIPSFVGQDGRIRSIRHANEYWDHYGVAVHEEQAQLGDLVFFSRNGAFTSHVGILTYHGTYIHAPGKDDTTVCEDPLPITDDERRIESEQGKGRQLYVRNPIGFKTLVIAAERPTVRYHQQLLD